MNELVFLQNDQPLTTSLKVAEVFEREHKNVVRDIENLIADCEKMASESESSKVSPREMFQKSSYKVEGNFKEYPMYLINRDGFTLLAMGFTGKKALQFKLKYIQAFNAMEQDLIKIATEHKILRDSTKKGYRKLTDSIKANVIPVARANGSKTEERFFYINAANALNSAVGCKPYSRDDLSVTQLNMLDQLQDIAAFEYKQAVKMFHNTKQINSYVKDKLAACSQVLSVAQRLALN